MREIRTLRATWRGLETWCGSGPPAHTGAPALDPTDERGWETGRWPWAPSYRAHPRLYHSGQLPFLQGLWNTRTIEYQGQPCELTTFGLAEVAMRCLRI
jgi:hypothetical protein